MLSSPISFVVLVAGLAGCQSLRWRPSSLHAESSYEGPVSEVEELEVDELVERLLQGQADEAPRVFRFLIQAGDKVSVQAAWRVAATYPSPTMAALVASRLARVSASGSGKTLYPEVAEAVAANGIVAAYPLIRPSLMESGHVAFAKAMATLRPERASDDFVGYLAHVEDDPAENETVRFVLEHMASHPPSVHHPQLEILFAMASEPGGDAAAKVIAALVPAHAQTLAFLLSRTPVEIQAGFLAVLEKHHPDVVSVLLEHVEMTVPLSKELSLRKKAEGAVSAQ